jgi:hypothetical protein
MLMKRDGEPQDIEHQGYDVEELEEQDERLHRILWRVSSAFVGVDGGGGMEVVRGGEEEKAIWWRTIVNESYLWLGFLALPRRYAQFSLVYITFGCLSSCLCAFCELPSVLIK